MPFGKETNLARTWAGSWVWSCNCPWLTRCVTPLGQPFIPWQDYSPGRRGQGFVWMLRGQQGHDVTLSLFHSQWSILPSNNITHCRDFEIPVGNRSLICQRKGNYLLFLLKISWEFTAWLGKTQIIMNIHSVYSQAKSTIKPSTEILL